MTLGTIIRYELIAVLFVVVLQLAACIRIPRMQVQAEPHIPTAAEDWDAEFYRLTGQPAFPPAPLCAVGNVTGTLLTTTTATSFAITNSVVTNCVTGIRISA